MTRGWPELAGPDGWSLVTIAYNHAMSRASVSAAVLRLSFVLAWLGCVFGCGSSGGGRAEMASAYPLDRVRAAVQSAEAGDADAVDLLIELLDDADRAVRMYSILALERLCGEDYGYRYYAPEAERTAAIARWREARQSDEVTVRTPADRRAGQSAAGTYAPERSEESSP